MRIHVNGEVKDVPEGLDLKALLELLSLPQQRVAVELDRKVIRRVDWPLTNVSEGSQVEIVHFVGAG